MSSQGYTRFTVDQVFEGERVAGGENVDTTDKSEKDEVVCPWAVVEAGLMAVP